MPIIPKGWKLFGAEKRLYQPSVAGPVAVPFPRGASCSFSVDWTVGIRSPNRRTWQWWIVLTPNTKGVSLMPNDNTTKAEAPAQVATPAPVPAQPAADAVFRSATPH